MTVPLVEIIAHRGAGQGFVRRDAPPENTLAALRDGWSRTEACELDVHLTGDGELIVIHDDTTARTTDCDWVVAQRRLAELRTLDAGAWKGTAWAGERLPALAEALDLLPDGKGLYVELKAGPAAVPPLAALLRGHPRREQVAILSFNVEAIVAARRSLPDCRCYWLWSFERDDAGGGYTVRYKEGPRSRGRRRPAGPADLDELVAFASEAGLDGVDSTWILPDGLLPRLAARSLEAMVWTVNDPEIALTCADHGVAGITTDDPDAIREALVRQGVTVGPRR